jgi:hypothetical protein
MKRCSHEGCNKQAQKGGVCSHMVPRRKDAAMRGVQTAS